MIPNRSRRPKALRISIPTYTIFWILRPPFQVSNRDPIHRVDPYQTYSRSQRTLKTLKFSAGSSDINVHCHRGVSFVQRSPSDQCQTCVLADWAKASSCEIRITLVNPDFFSKENRFDNTLNKKLWSVLKTVILLKSSRNKKVLLLNHSSSGTGIILQHSSAFEIAPIFQPCFPTILSNADHPDSNLHTPIMCSIVSFLVTVRLSSAYGSPKSQ